MIARLTIREGDKMAEIVVNNIEPLWINETSFGYWLYDDDDLPTDLLPDWAVRKINDAFMRHGCDRDEDCQMRRIRFKANDGVSYKLIKENDYEKQ